MPHVLHLDPGTIGRPILCVQISTIHRRLAGSPPLEPGKARVVLLSRRMGLLLSTPYRGESRDSRRSPVKVNDDFFFLFFFSFFSLLQGQFPPVHARNRVPPPFNLVAILQGRSQWLRIL